MVTARAATPIAQGRGYQASIGAASLAVGPLVMAVGDLMHPKETWDLSVQAAMVTEQATRWYLAHLLLFVGMVLFVPGILTLSGLATAQRPRVGYAARVLALIGVAGSSAVFLTEMLAGRFASAGAAATEDLLDAMFSGPIAGPMIPVTLALFVGAALFAVPLMVAPGPLRWPAVVFLVGMLLVLAEIVSSQVLLSQVGNLLIWSGSVAFAWRVVRGEAGPPVGVASGGAYPASALSSSRATSTKPSTASASRSEK